MAGWFAASLLTTIMVIYAFELNQDTARPEARCLNPSPAQEPLGPDEKKSTHSRTMREASFDEYSEPNCVATTEMLDSPPYSATVVIRRGSGVPPSHANASFGMPLILA